ncbi:MAG: DsbA family protein [Pseudomonadota bacterium]
MQRLSRRQLGFLTMGLVAAAGSSRSWAGDVGETAIGDPNAPVTMIEYSSLSCPHCASFHNNTYPELKKRYIDTGKVRMIFRDFPLNQPAVLATVIAHCGGSDRYIGFIDMMFKTQATWAQSHDPMSELKKLARLGGLSEERVDACLNDQDLVDGILQGRLDWQKEHNVQSTPTFVINDEVYPGNRSIDDFAAIIEPLIGGAS